MQHKIEIELGGRTLAIETGDWARQATGAARVRYGDTVVFSAVSYERYAKSSESDWFPLTVDYREQTYAGGKIPGGFFKREGRPREKEILGCRVIDRPIRPLFPENFRKKTQIISYLSIIHLRLIFQLPDKIFRRVLIMDNEVRALLSLPTGFPGNCQIRRN